MSLQLPEFVSDQVLNKETGVQDVIARRLLGFIDKLNRISGTNRELLVCSRQKLEGFTNEFLMVCHQLRRFMRDFSKYHSVIPELQEAREVARAAFSWHISDEIQMINDTRHDAFAEGADQELDRFRRKLARAFGVVRTELQKIFAYLLGSDPRNLYRAGGRRSQKDILFRQFKHDVEVTQQLYVSIRRLDTYMRGAIVPSDLLALTADRIEREESISYLLESEEYALFLNALVDEVLEQLVPEVQAVLDLEGVWYDDYENIQKKTDELKQACIALRELYRERSELRAEVAKVADQQSVLEVFNRFRYAEYADRVRQLNQLLVDLESTLLQWERGISRRAFAREEWREEEPLQRRSDGMVLIQH